VRHYFPIFLEIDSFFLFEDVADNLIFLYFFLLVAPTGATGWIVCDSDNWSLFVEKYEVKIKKLLTDGCYGWIVCDSDKF